MSVTLPPRHRPRRRAHQDQAGRAGLRDLLAATAAAVGLLLIVAGVPVLLAVLTGAPWPGHPPTISGIVGALTRPDDGHLIVGVLRGVAWVSWAAVTLSVATETAAACQGRPAVRLPGLGGLQEAVARLVTVAALLAPAVPITLTGHAVAPAITAAAFTAPHPQPSAAAPSNSGPAATVVPASPGHTVSSAGPVYVVRGPHDGHRDSLWSIAATHLGDPLRWREIADLNYGRPQPDGRTLTDPHWIQPGWRLTMPSDATGLTRTTPSVPPVTGTAPGVPAPTDEPGAAPTHELSPPHAPQAADPSTVSTSVGRSTGPLSPRAAEERNPAAEAPPGSSPLGSVPEPTAPAAPAARAPAAADELAPSDSSSSDDEIPVPLGLAGAGLLAAGVLALLTRRRRQQRRTSPGSTPPRPTGAQLQTEVALRVLADPDDVTFLDHALRALPQLLQHPAGDQTSEAAQPRPLPTLATASLSQAGLRLHLTEPRSDAPPPFLADPDGQIWSLSRAEALPPAGDTTSPYPALTPVGRDPDGLVLLNLECLGSAGIDGAPDVTLSLLRRIAVDLTVARWADFVEITVVGFGAELASLDPDRLDHRTTLDDATLRGLEAHAAGVRNREQRTPPADRSGTGAVDEPPALKLLLLAQRPPPDLEARLLRACGDGGARLVAVCAGNWPGAVRTLALTGGALRVTERVTVEAASLAAVAGSAITELIDSTQRTTERPAHDDSTDPAPAAAATTSHPAVAFPEPAAASVPVGPPSSQQLHAAGTALAPLRVLPHPNEPRHDGGDEDDLDRDLLAWNSSAGGGVVKVSILGPVEVHAGEALPGHRAPLLTELVVLLALHPTGIDVDAFDEALWPHRRIKPATRHEALARTRRWLGTTPSGDPYLPTYLSGRISLTHNIALDWDLLQRLADRAETRPDPSADREAALSLIRGTPFLSLPAHRYAWLTETYLETEIPVAITRLASAHAAQKMREADFDAVRAAAKIALTVDRYNEKAWRFLIQAEIGSGNDSAARELATTLLHTFDEEQCDLDPETATLLDDVAG